MKLHSDIEHHEISTLWLKDSNCALPPTMYNILNSGGKKI